MPNQFEQEVHELKLLRVMVQIREWEDRQLPELHTISGRNLYFRVAASCLNDSWQTQHLKSYLGVVSERSTRQRMREFEEMGLIHLVDNADDQRSKRAVPTAKFLKRLNQHLDLLKSMCNHQFLMLDKNT